LPRIPRGSRRGEESGLTDEEIAFYDALVQNGSAREVMGEPQLRAIAHKLVASIKNTLTVDWMHAPGGRTRKNSRACEENSYASTDIRRTLQDAAV
jgi:type I restriction enzyme, R subunit